MNYYLLRGINLMIWNYRGYFRSTGSPSPDHLLQDGERLVQYMREEMQLRGPLGVHGESLGGFIACHIAEKCKLDFLFADRTFSSFADVARIRSFSCSASLLRFFTCWRAESVQKCHD